MRPPTLLRLALAGTRTDTLRVMLTAISATLAVLALLSAATVLAIPAPPAAPDGGPPLSEQYTVALLREPGLRPGVALTFMLLCIPILALAAQCSRLGAPARDRRLAAIRLAGATPLQTLQVIAVETGLASVIGSIAGLGIYLVGRQLAHHPNAAGQVVLPTDVLPAPGVIIAISIGLPIAATLTAALLLRHVRVTPLGVVRRGRRTRAPRPWPAVLIGLGIGVFALMTPFNEWLERTDRYVEYWVWSLLLLSAALLAAIGVVIGTGWISYATGATLHRLARRPAGLLAGRRLMLDPWNGSRTLAALLVCVLVGGGAVGVRAWFTTMLDVRRESQRQMDTLLGQSPIPESDSDLFYVQTMNLVDLAVAVAAVIAAGGLLVAVAESIIARRRAYASLIATGLPRAVLARSILWQALAPAAPAIVLATSVGFLLTRGIQSEVTEGGGSGEICDGTEAVCADAVARVPVTRIVEFPSITRAIAVPFADLSVVTLGSLAAVLVAVGVGLLFLRSSTALEELRTN